MKYSFLDIAIEIEYSYNRKVSLYCTYKNKRIKMNSHLSTISYIKEWEKNYWIHVLCEKLIEEFQFNLIVSIKFKT